jgi:hypothetical protein
VFAHTHTGHLVELVMSRKDFVQEFSWYLFYSIKKKERKTKEKGLLSQVVFIKAWFCILMNELVWIENNDILDSFSGSVKIANCSFFFFTFYSLKTKTDNNIKKKKK